VSDSTGIASVDHLVTWSVAVAAVVGLVAMVWRAARGIARRLDHLLDDWAGEPARPGVPARPGLVERIARIEDRQLQQGARLAAIEHELHPNSGSSLRDAVDRVERHVCPPPAPEEPSLPVR
jgi:hypothetical protein